MTARYNCGVPIQFEGFKNCNAPQDVFCFFDDFIGSSHSATADAAVWMSAQAAGAGSAAVMGDTEANGGLTVAYQQLAGGWLTVTPSATAADGLNLVVNGESFQVDQGYPLYFETRLLEVDIDDTTWWVGLTGSPPDVSVIAGGVGDAAIGFESDNAGAVSYLCATGGTEKKTAITGLTVADNDILKLAFYYDGANTITFYYAECSAKGHTGELLECGSYKLSTTAHYCPEDKMLTPTIEVCRAAGADVVCFDYVLCVQARCQTTES